MKPSRYNFVYPYQFNRDYSVVYNTLKDSVGIVTAREAEFIRTCDRSLGIHYTKIDVFKEKGFIIDENTSELSALKVEYLRSKFDEKLLSVVIVPTYQCNLNCECCYEKLSYGATDNTVMSEQVQDSIYDWITRNLSGVEKLEISWHGGEPLIALDAVRRLGGMLKKLADEQGIEYSARMSTNGYLLTGTVAKELELLGIRNYKMSMAGCRENHDRKKRHKDGSATYDTILGNIEDSIGAIEEIDLRINVNKDNLNDAYEIVKILEQKNLRDKVNPRLGKPVKFADEINEKEFTKEEFFCEAVQFSLLQGIGPKEFSKKDCFCQINRLNGIIVDGHGTLFKCVSDTGDGQSCGKLEDDGSLNFNKNFYAYGLNNPMESELCENCPFLPICIGECAYDRREGNPCAFASLEEECWAQFLNAYVVKRLLNRLKTEGFFNGDNEINMEKLLMGRYDEHIAKFIKNAASTYMLGDLIALAQKNSITLNHEDGELLLQLIQPTELAI